MKVKVISLFEKQTDPKGLYINTTSSAEKDWHRDFSPFYLGPCELYGGFRASNMENSWQYSKVYPQHADGNEPTAAYWEWAMAGWRNPRAVRYPMGKGQIPLYSLWDESKLDYIAARKVIYAPLYIKAVKRTYGWELLSMKYLLDIAYDTIYLRDYDAYRHEDYGMTLTDVVNNPKKKMGHAFVLAMLLTDDPALKLFTL